MSSKHVSYSARDLLQGVQGRKVLVIGDVMADHHYYVARGADKEHRSPGGVYPIYDVINETVMTGGAAMVAATVTALGCVARCIGVIGRDDRGRKLVRTLREFDVPPDGLVKSSDRITTMKLRICHRSGGADEFQIIQRVDHESRAAVRPETTLALLKAFEEELPGAHVIVLEDHEKGVLTADIVSRIFSVAAENNIPVVVSPKFHWSKYRGFDIAAVVPSYDEFCRGALDIEPILHEPEPKQIELAMDRWPKVHAWVIPDEQGTTLVSMPDPERPYQGELYRTDAVTSHPDRVPGCGAAFTAGFAAGLAAHEDAIRATLLATLVAGRQATMDFGRLVAPAAVRSEVSPRKAHHIRTVFSSAVGTVAAALARIGATHVLPEVVSEVAADQAGCNRGLLDTIQSFTKSSAQWGLLITAPPRSGKTHTVERFLAACGVKYDYADATKISQGLSARLDTFLQGAYPVLLLDEFLKVWPQMLDETSALPRGVVRINGQEVPLGTKKIVALGAVEEDEALRREVTDRFPKVYQLPRLTDPIDRLNVFGLSLLYKLSRDGNTDRRICIDRHVVAALLIQAQYERMNAGPLAGLGASLAVACGARRSIDSECWLDAGKEARWLEVAQAARIPGGRLVLQLS